MENHHVFKMSMIQAKLAVAMDEENDDFLCNEVLLFLTAPLSDVLDLSL